MFKTVLCYVIISVSFIYYTFFSNPTILAFQTSSINITSEFRKNENSSILPPTLKLWE